MHIYEHSINELLNDSSLIESVHRFGFYDWFCSDKSLKNKAIRMLTKVRFLVKEGILDGDGCYVWFKNNCPMDGSLYDDFRISRISDSEFLGGCIPRSGYASERGTAEVWLLKDDMETFTFNSWSDLKHKIKTDSDLKEKLTAHFNPK